MRMIVFISIISKITDINHMDSLPFIKLSKMRDINRKDISKEREDTCLSIETVE